jgi:O-methyltransferase
MRGIANRIRLRLKSHFRAAVVRAARWLVPSWIAGRLANLAALSRMSSWIAAGAMDCTGDRTALYERVLRGEGLDLPVDFLEFGVFQGASLRWWSGHLVCPDARFYAFDCFEGLPENWGVAQKGTFDTGRKVPDIGDARVQFVVGLFQDTLVPFLRKTPLRRRKIIHMDADLYSSTLYVLAQLSPHICPGDIIIFDEFGSIRMAQHEFRAFEDFSRSFGMTTVRLGANSLLETVALKVVTNPAASHSPQA